MFGNHWQRVEVFVLDRGEVLAHKIRKFFDRFCDRYSLGVNMRDLSQTHTFTDDTETHTISIVFLGPPFD